MSAVAPRQDFLRPAFAIVFVHDMFSFIAEVNQ